MVKWAEFLNNVEARFVPMNNSSLAFPKKFLQPVTYIIEGIFLPDTPDLPVPLRAVYTWGYMSYGYYLLREIRWLNLYFPDVP